MSMAGRQIGPYKVLSTLHEGSDDHRVLLAQRPGVERLFAVKLFRPNLPSDVLERFQRGAHLAAKVNHPFVVRPIEIGRTPEGALFVACEHVLGESIRSCLERQGRYHWREAANLVADAAEGVEAAHRAGLVHRDLSPERLIYNRKTSHAMVLDFGLARDTLEPSGLSKTGELIGGLVYMSPEQLAGQRAESPSDVYALGTLLYELIAGELPYLGRDLEELRQKVTAGQRLDLRKHVPEVPRELVELLDRAMSVDPQPMSWPNRSATSGASRPRSRPRSSTLASAASARAWSASASRSGSWSWGASRPGRSARTPRPARPRSDAPRWPSSSRLEPKR